MPFDSHTTPTFVHMQQVSDELLEMYLHCACELLSKNSLHNWCLKIPVEGLNHYTMVYILDSNKLKYKVAGHWNA